MWLAVQDPGCVFPVYTLMHHARRVASLTAFILTLASVVALAAGTAPAQGAAAGAAEPAPDEVAALLRRQTVELMDAIAPGEAEIWRRYLLDDAVYFDENGAVYDKAKLLAELTPLPPGLVGRMEVDRFEPTLFGDAAVVVAEVQEYLDYHGQVLHTRFRFLDTWLRTPAGWRLAARHTAAVLKDPPAIALSAEELCAYAGVYRLTPEIETTVRCTEGGLVSERTGRPAETYLPEVRDLFFVAGKPRSRRIFLREGGAVVGFADRREGEDIRWTRTGDAPPPAKPDG